MIKMISKEVKAIGKALDAYYKKHKGKCIVICDIIAFEPNNDFKIVDDRIFRYGGDFETQKIMVDQLKKDIIRDIKRSK